MTECVATTEDGKQCWKDSAGDLNIGDLASYGADDDLKHCLEKRGAYNLDIEIFHGSDGDQDWTYATVLVDESQLPEEEEEEATDA